MSAKLFVGNLSPETSNDELREIFSKAGEVQSCQVITERDTGRSKGFAFIEMNSQETANIAKEKFNGQEVHGKALKVNDAKPRNEESNKNSPRLS
jgi:RNA recognition motif-containing protein